VISSPMSLTLSNFNLSADHGFLSDPDPLTVLPDSYIFSPLEKLANRLPQELAAGTLRKHLDENAQRLMAYAKRTEIHLDRYLSRENNRVLKRLKLIFDYLGQAYVWGQDPPARVIPAGFAEFWYRIAEKLDVPPILSYSSYVLDNWHRIDPSKPIELGNIAVNQNFLGDTDENWFILVHVDIEERAAWIPESIINMFYALSDKNVDVLETYLLLLTNPLKCMLQTLYRMPENCDEHIYYTRVRPYLHGSKNNPALPEGLLYDGVADYHGKPQQFRGESGAQSAIVPSLVAALDIRHTQTAFTPYLDEIRAYMPKGHRLFVETIEHLSRNGYSILDFVVQRKTSHPMLYDAYRACRQALYDFRRKHYEYVGRYIHSQAQQYAGNPIAIGTAGTPFMTSLKQLMDETLFE